jgi:hypothetical protein
MSLVFSYPLIALNSGNEKGLLMPTSKARRRRFGPPLCFFFFPSFRLLFTNQLEDFKIAWEAA